MMHVWSNFRTVIIISVTFFIHSTWLFCFGMSAGSNLRWGWATEAVPRGVQKHKYNPHVLFRFCCSKIKKILLIFLTIIRNKNKKKYHNLTLLLLTGTSTFWLPQRPWNCKSDRARLPSSENTFTFLPIGILKLKRIYRLYITSTLITLSHHWCWWE